MKKDNKSKLFKNDDRFKLVFNEGIEGTYEGRRQILVDQETGVHYLTWMSGNGGGITPLLGTDGKPVIHPVMDEQ